MDRAIDVRNLSKMYKLYNGSKERLLDFATPRSYGDSFYALRDISFQAEQGDVVGFVGINGSGKSTLANVIAGVVPETDGSVSVNGEVSLIAVNSGLKGDLTGRDNIELKCLMLGFSKDEIKELEPGIIEFAELDQFIDQPVKSYSSGMKSRLGFAISINIDPDVLIIDEALSVGDKAFAEKSLNKMKEFKTQGKTMIFVSHSIGQMRQFCDKILWLEYGRVRTYGDVEEIIPQYEQFLADWKKMTKQERVQYKTDVLNGAQPQQDLAEEPAVKAKQTYKTYYKEEPVSKLGHIKGGISSIFPSLDELDQGMSSDQYKNHVYYIKREAVYYDELFYLLSTEPSAQTGVIGWMKASDMASHVHIAIDSDPKTCYLTGAGAAYSLPWGGRRNQLIADLGPYEDTAFPVDQTDKIGNNVWYRGTLEGEHIWVHAKHVTGD
ncbi:hypothetical protein GCM10028778_15600 [Barrientosiimonas marina]|uniref:Teichoic acids export ABC transporter ATP-binding subunit TagH n=1 Tax=Lentibacillus kimchii TaxID=1542911 RepID=A0ABW2UTJ6_9BACI